LSLLSGKDDSLSTDEPSSLLAFDLPARATCCALMDGAERQADHFIGKMRFRWWIPPGCLFFVCFVMQNFGLYIGTYYYVMWMDRLDVSLKDEHILDEALIELNMSFSTMVDDDKLLPRSHLRRPHSTATATSTVNQSMAIMESAVHEELSSEVDEGSLHDVFTDYLGRYNVPTTALDALSAIAPMGIVGVTLLTGDLRLWSKCCLCAALLALLKGFLAWATVVPDSIGWDGCQKRLGPAGVGYFRDKKGLNFETEPFSSFFAVLKLELLGVWYEGSYHHIRFCGDMMFSGHTYVCGVFSLGLYDALLGLTATWAPVMRVPVRILVGVLLFGLVCFDMTLILMKRFHYTMDVTVAIVLVGLLYSNPGVAVAVERYTVWAAARTLAADFEQMDNKEPGAVRASVDASYESDKGSVLVPPCCFPLCCFQGRYHLQCRPDQ